LGMTDEELVKKVFVKTQEILGERYFTVIDVDKK